jgi:hypothetical protein
MQAEANKCQVRNSMLACCNRRQRAVLPNMAIPLASVVRPGTAMPMPPRQQPAVRVLRLPSSVRLDEIATDIHCQYQFNTC